MSENELTGGPAFPRPYSHEEIDMGELYVREAQDGMTLRDYFAAKVLQAIVGNSVLFDYSREDKVKMAYGYADLMLEARKKH